MGPCNFVRYQSTGSESYPNLTSMCGFLNSQKLFTNAYHNPTMKNYNRVQGFKFSLKNGNNLWLHLNSQQLSFSSRHMHFYRTSQCIHHMHTWYTKCHLHNWVKLEPNVFAQNLH
jgi:hypothetical protein